MEEEKEKKPRESDGVCARCGLRAYDAECGNCGAPIVDKTDDEDEEYDWREHKR